MKTIKAADLFCGAGGSSSGLKRIAAMLGARLQLVAVNHWQLAIETHAANHPDAEHISEDVATASTKRLTGGKLDVLWASPACTEHSYARGDLEMGAEDQSRASAWAVLRWVDETRPEWLIIENVPAMMKWGPLGRSGRPLETRKGETYHAYLAAIRSRGYTVEARVLNSADHGAATARPRLFVMGRFDGGRSRGAIPWPLSTHAESALPLFNGHVPPWRGASEIIDWSLKGRSIFDPNRRIADSTLRRIQDGLTRFGGAPFVLGQQSGAVARPLTAPLPTIATKGAISLIQPFLINYYSSGSGLTARSVTRPLPTITTRDRFGLVQADGDDITLRMLALRELARGMGFDDDYRFIGGTTAAKAMVGNAVEVNQAAALWTNPVEQVMGIRRAA